MTVLEGLQSITVYPIPANTVREKALQRDLDVDAVLTSTISKSDAYRLVQADLFVWLSNNPNSVSEGGVAISISNPERLRKMGTELYNAVGVSSGGSYGYKGDSL